MKWRRSLRHGGAAFHVDDAAAAAALEQRLEQQHQVFGFFLDFHVAVAQDAEHAPAGDAHGRGTAGRNRARSHVPAG